MKATRTLMLALAAGLGATQDAPCTNEACTSLCLITPSCMSTLFDPATGLCYTFSCVVNNYSKPSKFLGYQKPGATYECPEDQPVPGKPTSPPPDLPHPSDLPETVGRISTEDGKASSSTTADATASATEAPTTSETTETTSLTTVVSGSTTLTTAAGPSPTTTNGAGEDDSSSPDDSANGDNGGGGDGDDDDDDDDPAAPPIDLPDGAGQMGVPALMMIAGLGLAFL